MSGVGAEAAGNYKGVMLCNRPMETGAQRSGPGAANLNPQLDAPRFRPVGLPMEQIGLNPSKENVVTNVGAMHKVAAERRAERPDLPGPDNFMVKHRKWLANMAKMKQELNTELQEAALAAETKRTKFVAYTAAQRQAMRESKASVPAAAEDTAPPASVPPTPPAAPAPAPPSAKAPPSKASRPKWALTEGEADDVEDDEAEQLVDFANGLDYDTFIDDLEVRQALTVIKERIDSQKAVEAVAQRVEAAADEARAAAEAAGVDPNDWRQSFLAKWNDDDAVSQSARSTSRRAPAADATATGKEWDSSTSAGEVTRAGPSENSRQAADELLKSNPALAAKHSVRSLAAAIERCGKDEVVAAATKSTLRSVAEESASLPPLKIVTLHENPRVLDKQIDASNLPYLHRNPAV